MITILGNLLKSFNRKVTIFDVGSHVGSFSLGFNHILNQNCEIHLFEAQRIISYMNSGTMALNGFENVYCNFKAVSNVDGDRINIPKFDYNAPNSFGSIEFGPVQRESLTQQRQYDKELDVVETITLDAYIENNPYITNIDFVKIDVEGMELPALDGFSSLRKFKPIFYIEYIKCGIDNIMRHHALKDYEFLSNDMDVLCVHKNSNPTTIFNFIKNYR
jgi:FkbM family methyltransferase